MAKKGRDHPGQMLIEWSAVASAPLATNESQAPPSSHAITCTRCSPRPEAWDFVNVFPEPLEESIEAGVIDASDATPASLQSLHAVIAREALAVLVQRDAAMLLKHKRQGHDRPTAAELFGQRFEAMMLIYADAFGTDAAEAFRSFLFHRHADLLYKQRLEMIDTSFSARVRLDGDSPLRDR